MQDPLLVSGTDGVGTKLLVARIAGKHDTIGQDLVAMCVNDIITCGAEPLFFLDYFATGGLKDKVYTAVIKSIARACKDSNCALIGGETAEMPGVYGKGEYDLAGFCVGLVEARKMINGKKVKNGFTVLGLSASGLHSNGFSLVRRVFSPGEIKGKWGPELLKPTRLYVKSVLSLVKAEIPAALAHITGGGFYENIPRCLPKGLSVIIKQGSWRIPPIFKEVQRRGKIAEPEMYRTFNMGIGMAVITEPKKVKRAVAICKKSGIKAYPIGEVVKGKKGVVIG
jgi:phosphoribosylformylglycinamidine cyclo-ligase